MITNKLPMVLLGPGKYSSISMERSLKQIKDLLEHMHSDHAGAMADRINASIDDIDVMLAAIYRG